MNKRIYDSKIERPRAQVGIWSHHLYPEGPQALQIPAQFAKLLETRLVKPLEQKQKPNKNISIIYIFSKTCIGFCPHWITMNQLTTLRDERFREICWINFLCHLQRGNAFMFTCSKNMLITRPPQLITKNGHKQNKCVFPSSLFMSRDWVAFMISLTLSTFSMFMELVLLIIINQIEFPQTMTGFEQWQKCFPVLLHLVSVFLGTVMICLGQREMEGEVKRVKRKIHRMY